MESSNNIDANILATGNSESVSAMDDFLHDLDSTFIKMIDQRKL